MSVEATRPARLAVGVVGIGRVGSALAIALGRAGHEIVAVSGVSPASRERAGRLPGVPLLAPPDVVRRSALVLLTTPDDQLPGLVRGLADDGAFRRGQLVVHCSGRFGLGVLQPAVDEGALPMALHPVMTFAGTSDDAQRVVGASFGVTAPTSLRPVAEALVIEMEGEPVWVPDAARPLYHAALAFASNNLVTLVSQSAELLASAGLERPHRALAPLLSAALDNVLLQGDDALTGPVARGDAETVAAHLAALRTAASQTVPAYVAMARLTAERALAAGRLSAVDAERLLDVLAAPRGAGAQT